MPRPDPPFADERELQALISAFESRTLPRAAWTHAAHLTVGTWYVHQLGAQAAFAVLRQRIRALNQAHGTANTETGGYHDSVTWLYLAVISAQLTTLPAGLGRAEAITRVIAGPVDDLAFGYYTRELLWSREARRRFVAPDLRPLPVQPDDPDEASQHRA